jgi:hypothetical protein
MGEAPGGGADVDGDLAARVDGERGERVGQLVAPAAHEARPGHQIQLGPRRDQRSRLVHPLAVDEHVAGQDHPRRLLA